MTVRIHVVDNNTPSTPDNTDTNIPVNNEVVPVVNEETPAEQNNAPIINNNSDNNEPEVPATPTTHRKLVLYIGKGGRIVKRSYITVTEGETDLTVLTRLAVSKSKLPKGYKATGKVKKVAKHLDVWVSKSGQPGNKRAPRTKDVLYVTKSGKIVKRTRITGSVRKLAKSKLPKGYKITGIDRVNNHYNVWISKTSK